MHKKSFFCIALIAAQLFTLPVLSYADVTTVQESHGPAGAVYVAGNPDCYPIEYYDEKEECYRGVLPELLADISEESGVDFVYVGGGGKDRRASMAQNRQVELVSCCLGEKELSIITGAPVLSVTMGDETYKVSFGYTEIATEELKTLCRRGGADPRSSLGMVCNGRSLRFDGGNCCLGNYKDAPGRGKRGDQQSDRRRYRSRKPPVSGAEIF